jgi:hypothetical protein
MRYEDFMPARNDNTARLLSRTQIEQFIQDGFVRIDGAFPRQLADRGRAILWRDLPCDPDDPATWTRPVVRLGWYGDEPFKEAANTPALHAAFDQLVGRGRWRPRPNLGTFPVRFPSPADPGDAGWHIDVSFPGPTAGLDERKDLSDSRANIISRGRALLMLFLFSDVGEADAPTRIKVGSHRDIARQLAPAGEAGLSNAMLGDFEPQWIGPRCSPPAKPARSISVTRSCCTRHKCIGAWCRVSSRNHHFIPLNPFSSIGRTATIRRSKSQSVRRSGKALRRADRRQRHPPSSGRGVARAMNPCASA